MQELEEALKKAGELAGEGELEAALGVLEAAPESVQLWGRYQFAKGALYYRFGRLREAVTAFENALTLGPPLPEFFSNLGVALLDRIRGGGEEEADLERALESLEYAVELGPRLPHSYVNLGEAWLMKGDSERGRYYLELALELFPDSDVARQGVDRLSAG